jgi:hypothetical protein
MLDPEKDNNSKKFWKYIKSRKQDTMGIGTIKNNGVLAETAEQKAEMLTMLAFFQSSGIWPVLIDC